MTENFGPYTSLKFIHHADRIASAANGGVPAPVNIQLVLSNACNLNCSFCYYRNDMFPAAQGNFKQVRDAIMPTSKALEIVHDCQEMGVKSITLTGGGEPTVHPDFDLIFNSILDNGIELGLITNGVKLSEEVIERVRDREFQWARVSLDAGTPDSFARIKQAPAKYFERAMESVWLLAAAKRKYNATLVIGVGMVVTPENYDDILLLGKCLKGFGVDSFRIRSVAGEGLNAFYGDKAGEIQAICREAEKLSGDGFTVENLFKDDFKVVKHSPVCLYQYLHTYIGADMNVYTCCLYSYSDFGKKGSIAERSFKDFWFSPEHTRYLKTFDPLKCPTCDFQAKNELLRYIASPDPVNVNFV